ncbi:unnamed protein product [Euphydryas editha]|uniref:Peptidase S1 domain-containing protein n=1 Tax=Euphydryas editha TaxID=104508 RepID=A0AAU9TYK7_EUPED|nr:unnamed protein product [Euphydryas editha]
MRILMLIIATAALLLTDVASEEDGIKRGTFPFMAFVYYPDQTVDDGFGGKFTRSAVLIRQNWLISASLETENTLSAFPEKTLVARLGAISIDDKFNFNLDESEQEREIIRVARPYDFNRTEWWYSDISLLKTLLPFNITATVAPFPTRDSKLIPSENCFMLVYANHIQKESEGRLLMKIAVELIPPSQDKCGNNFSNDTMVCAVLSNEKSNIYTNSNFCLGNNGGPLICDDELVGTQTYINNCNQPYLYQLLRSWDDLISCAIEEKCEEEQCAKICLFINKDPITTVPTTSTTSVTEDVKFKLADAYVNETSISTIKTPTLTTAAESSEIVVEETTSTTVKGTQGTTKTTSVTHLNSFNTVWKLDNAIRANCGGVKPATLLNSTYLQKFNTCWGVL